MHQKSLLKHVALARLLARQFRCCFILITARFFIYFGIKGKKTNKKPPLGATFFTDKCENMTSWGRRAVSGGLSG